MNGLIIPAILSIISAGIAIFAVVKLLALQKRVDDLTQGVAKKDIVELVTSFSKQNETIANDIVAIHAEFSKIREDTKKFFRKVGLVRYQGFSNTGGDQSFSIALLDDTYSGFVLTSLYGRDFSKTYAKRIENGKPSHPLTEEEQEALIQAKKS